ncbi:unnamed protein product [Owenia fusiformis]|uniref:Uncharacterized protein n=1 Tax=Owenia fusiformis TaxID=6347 RepID=A0A8J1UXR3_OWEFU|nr:unnamed protein product [Owenia fusiformis]
MERKKVLLKKLIRLKTLMKACDKEQNDMIEKLEAYVLELQLNGPSFKENAQTTEAKNGEMDKLNKKICKLSEQIEINVTQQKKILEELKRLTEGPHPAITPQRSETPVKDEPKVGAEKTAKVEEVAAQSIVISDTMGENKYEVYEHNEDTQNVIYHITCEKCGVGATYIGSTTKASHERKMCHIGKVKSSVNYYELLYKHFVNCGIKNFKYTTIDHEPDEDKLKCLETAYMTRLRTIYHGRDLRSGKINLN